MRISICAAVALGALSLAACSKPTQEQVKADVKDAGAHLQDAVQAVANDPGLKDAAASAKDAASDAKDALSDAGATAKVAATNLKDQARDAADQAKADANKAAEKTKAAANDAKEDLKR